MNRLYRRLILWLARSEIDAITEHAGREIEALSEHAQSKLIGQATQHAANLLDAWQNGHAHGELCGHKQAFDMRETVVRERDGVDMAMDDVIAARARVIH